VNFGLLRLTDSLGAPIIQVPSRLPAQNPGDAARSYSQLKLKASPHPDLKKRYKMISA
jgi:hypothetical protein